MGVSDTTFYGWKILWVYLTQKILRLEDTVCVSDTVGKCYSLKALCVYLTQSGNVL